MPAVKFLRVVSSLNEDPAHPASNALKVDDTERKWKCKTPELGEMDAVFEFEKPCQVVSIYIGNENSAFIEILGAKSEDLNSFKPLITRSPLMSVQEAKTGNNMNGAFFYGDSFVETAKDEEWARLKVVCSQPYNKLAKFGLSFILLRTDYPNEEAQERSSENIKLKDNNIPQTGQFSTPKTNPVTPEQLTCAASIYAAKNNPASIKLPSSQNFKLATVGRQFNIPKEEQLMSPVDVTNKTSPDVSKGVQTKSFNKLFENVIFAISGYKNPLRSELRNKAVAMGAIYKSDWDTSCTHLISACVGTPRFNQAKGKSKIVKRYWIEDSYNKRIAYPWRRYALDISDANQAESDDEIHEKEEDNNEKKRTYKELDALSECDEEPEIKKPKQ